MVLNIGIAYKIPAVTLRYFNVFGTRQSLSNPYNGVVAIFMSRIKNGKPPIINEDGLQSRDFIHVKDVTSANIAALEKDEANYQIFNVGSGKPIPIVRVAEILISLYKSKLKPEVTFKVRKLDVRHCFADISKISQLLEWKPEVEFEDGLKEIISWSQSEKAVDKLDSALRELERRGLR